MKKTRFVVQSMVCVGFLSTAVLLWLVSNLSDDGQSFRRNPAAASTERHLAQRSLIKGSTSTLTSTAFVLPTQKVYVHNESFHCVSASVNAHSPSFPICTYRIGQDLIVSANILSGDYWENTQVERIVNVLQSLQQNISIFTSSAGDDGVSRRRQPVFVDIGAFIGSYALPVSHIGIPVIAIEPNPESVRRLRKAVELGNLTSANGRHFVLLQNVVSDETGVSVDLDVNLSNRGGTHVRRLELCRQHMLIYPSDCLVNVSRTVTLDDLVQLVDVMSVPGTGPPRVRGGHDGRPKVVIKADIESYELKVFNERSAAEFFDAVDVVAVQLEWDVIAQSLFNADSRRTTEARRKARGMLQFFVDRGYRFSSATDGKSLSFDDWLNWASERGVVNLWIDKMPNRRQKNSSN